jgi:hypothetical protein
MTIFRRHRDNELQVAERLRKDGSFGPVRYDIETFQYKPNDRRMAVGNHCGRVDLVATARVRRQQ